MFRGSLTIVLGDKVDLDSAERRDALVDGLLGDTSRDVALGSDVALGGSAGGNGGTCNTGAGDEELASGDAKDAGERRSRAVLDQRGEADCTGSDASGGTHIEWSVKEVDLSAGYRI